MRAMFSLGGVYLASRAQVENMTDVLFQFTARELYTFNDYCVSCQIDVERLTET